MAKAQATKSSDKFRGAELAKIHMAKKELGLGEDTYRDIIFVASGNKSDSAGDLDGRGRHAALERFKELGWQPKPGKRGKATVTKKTFPGRPKNMDKPGESRDAKLGKIEALLTIGGLSWSYADGIAKQMKLADKVQWVDESKLYKIITALTKKAQKEGWDLSGAR